MVFEVRCRTAFITVKATVCGERNQGWGHACALRDQALCYQPSWLINLLRGVLLVFLFEGRRSVRSELYEDMGAQEHCYAVEQEVKPGPAKAGSSVTSQLSLLLLNQGDCLNSACSEWFLADVNP